MNNIPVNNTDFKTIKLPVLSRILKDAQLRYVNLEQLIADSKADRSSKRDAFLSCTYPDSYDLLLVSKGDIINAVRFTKSNRMLVPIDDVIQKAKKIKSGLLNLDQTELEVQHLLIKSICTRASIKRLEGASYNFKALLKYLHQKTWSGFVEFGHQFELNFLTIQDGQPRKLYLSEGMSQTKNSKIIGQLGEIILKNGYIIRCYQSSDMKNCFTQVNPSHIILFKQLIKDVFSTFQRDIGKRSSQEMFQVAKHELEEEYPLLQQTKIDLNGNLFYNGIAEGKTFTASMAAWLETTVRKTDETTVIEAVSLVHNILKPYSVTLSALGFYKNSPVLKKGS